MVRLFNAVPEHARRHVVRRIYVVNTHEEQDLRILLKEEGTTLGSEVFADGQYLVRAGAPPFELPVRGTLAILVGGSAAATTLESATSDVVLG